jgi:uncharacterized protein (TIGR03435 family)
LTSGTVTSKRSAMACTLLPALLACLCVTGAVSAQTHPPPHFEVASVKPAGDTFSIRPKRSGGRLSWTAEICYLIGYAFDLDSTRISGVKCGANYSIEATFDPQTKEEQLRLMLQSLLAERFGMQAHRAPRQTSGYALSIGKGRLRLKENSPSPEIESYVSAALREADVIAISGQSATMSQLAATVQRVLETPVWDRTGLSGSYDFAFRFTKGLSPGVADAPFIQAALQDLGLRLEKQQGPVQTLIVDSIHEPSRN